ncbi:MAG: hypothetical protein ACTS7E_00345 [Arsenophonus sp. NC-CH8-MAG3]
MLPSHRKIPLGLSINFDREDASRYNHGSNSIHRFFSCFKIDKTIERVVEGYCVAASILDLSHFNLNIAHTSVCIVLYGKQPLRTTV